jgi:hypothetical protein
VGKPQRSRLVFVVALVLGLLGGLRFAGGQDQQSCPKDTRGITGRELYELLISIDVQKSDRAKAIVGQVYSRNYGHGVIPGRSTLYRFAEITKTYLRENPGKMVQPAEAVINEVLGGVPDIRRLPDKIKEQERFWLNVDKAAKAYFAEPSPSNAQKLYMALPQRQLSVLDDDGFERVLQTIFDFFPGEGANFSILEKKIQEGEPNAADVGFRLINIADGAFAEVLLHDLGKILDKDAGLFLHKLAEHQGNTEPTVFDLLDSILYPVAWWERPDRDDDMNKYNEILKNRLENRIKALESIDDENVRPIRDRCLSILRADMPKTEPGAIK